jgi:hypothetical protein
LILMRNKTRIYGFELNIYMYILPPLGLCKIDENKQDKT